MNGVDFEYAIKKDVRNNPIVREVDEARQRQIRRSIGIGGLLVAVLLFSAWQNFELVQHGYDIQRLEQQHAEELEISRQLTLEVESLRTPARIEDIAKKRMNLVEPSADEAVVIERVTPAPPPGKSIVAAR